MSETTPTDLEALRDAVLAIGGGPKRATKMPKTWTCENGLVLNLRPVARGILTDVRNKIKMPEPPEVFDEEKQRTIVNEADPSYQRALEDYQNQRMRVTTNIMLGMGVTVDWEKTSSDLWQPNQHEWVDQLIELSEGTYKAEDFPESGLARFVVWLTMYAMPASDADNIMQNLYGNYVTQEDVEEAINGFPRDGERGVDSNGGTSTGQD